MNWDREWQHWIVREDIFGKEKLHELHEGVSPADILEKISSSGRNNVCQPKEEL